MSIIERISARSPVRSALIPPTLFALLLSAAALCGCARHYDIIMTNNRTVTNVRIPDLDKHLGYYTYVTAGGHKFQVPASSVSYIGPHGDTNWMFNNH
jgi:hypothetical protein